jgi:transcriptional regulator with XRE-family HTH domain
MAETVGDRIKRYRTDKGWNLTQLATETGLSKSYLSELEAITDANKRPSGQTLYGIAIALGVTIADLLGEPVATDPTSERPASLLKFARERELPEADVEMLASIRFRGETPKTAERWAYIYDSIRNSRAMDRARSS